eukprot:9081557-Lingulodinium_polyedra.AAC.1
MPSTTFLGCCIWSVAGDGDFQSLRKRACFHGSVLVQWGNGLAREGWYGNHNANPCISLCEHGAWDDDEEIVSQRERLAVFYETPRRFIQMRINLAEGMGPHSVLTTNCHNDLSKVLSQAVVAPEVVREFGQYMHVLCAPFLWTKPPHAPTRAWISRQMALLNSPSPV